jgi:hypothetical protein
MKSKTEAVSRRRIGFSLLALAAILSVWAIVVVPHALAAKSTIVKLDGVRTSLTTDAGTTTALFGAGIIPLPAAPTSFALTTHAARYAFPVTAGAVDGKTLVGKIFHSGGLLLVQRHAGGWRTLSLTKFTVVISAHPGLTAVVNGGARLQIAHLDLSKAVITRYMSMHRTFVHIANVGVTLNATAMGAINSTFGTSLPSSVKLGTADVLARVAR